jgi:hypothetical protein
MELNKQEIEDLKEHGYELSDKSPNGLIVSGLIVISHGNKELHDSGYPYIKIFGIIGKELVSLGWHDHWISYVPTNTDSFGKNIFHIMPWCEKRKWKVNKNFISLSTFQIGEYTNEELDFVNLE